MRWSTVLDDEGDQRVGVWSRQGLHLAPNGPALLDLIAEDRLDDVAAEALERPAQEFGAVLPPIPQPPSIRDFMAFEDHVTAGYRIGPFDVESVLITHPAVADVAVVGRPDPEGIRGEIVEAFVVLSEKTEPSDELAEELKQLVRDQYSKHAYPRAVHFVGALPKTPSGKVQRFLLRQC